MKYFLPELDYSQHNKRYAGDRARYATCTDVFFLEENKLLVASFADRKIFLIQLEGSDYRIVDQVEVDGFPDTLDYLGGKIITSNFPGRDKVSSISIFSLVNDRIIPEKTIPLKEFMCHGCCFLNSKIAVITSTYNDKRGIHFFNLESEKYWSFSDFEYFPKNVLYADSKLLVCTSSASPSSFPSPVQKSKIYLFDYKKMEKLDEISFHGQTDGVVLDGNMGFVSLHELDSIMQFFIEGKKLRIGKVIDGFFFPHGLDVHGDKIAVTNYGDNSFQILNLFDILA